MCHDLTQGDILESVFDTLIEECSVAMAYERNGVRYYNHTEVAKATGVTRQTLYRWIREGKIQSGNYVRVRDGRTFYSETELAAIREFANGLELQDGSSRDQLSLFQPDGSRS